MALTSWTALSSAVKTKVQNFLIFAKGEGENEIYALEVDPATGAIPVVFTPPALVLIDGGIRNNYVSSPVTTGAWVELVAATTTDITQLFIFDSSGQTLELGVGAAASEVRQCLIPPGGFDGPLPIAIPSGSRIAIKAISANASTGELVVNTMG